MRAMRVAEDDRIGVRKASMQKPRQRRVRACIAKAESPEERLRFLHPAAAIAVDENDAPTLDRELAGQGQRGEVAIVVTTHRLHRSDAFESRDRLRPADIARMQDQVDAA
jgi:hypothetical protein